MYYIDYRLSDEKIKELILAKLHAHSLITASGCWEWQGFRFKSGYGETSFRGKSWRVHRLAYVLVKGPIPDDLDVCHECDNPPCWNPDHLWPGTQQANSLDIVIKGRHYKASRTHCPRGHAFAEHGRPHSTHPAWRCCKACERGKQRIKAGWPENLAYTLPIQRLGYRPDGIGKLWNGVRAARGRRPRPLICKRGHPLVGGNLYLTPDGRRQCRTCHRWHVVASAKRISRSANEP